MTIATTLIPGLDEIVRNGDPERRAEAARRIADLFLEDAARLRPNHVDFFDEILIDLVPHTKLVTRAELAERLSLVVNAPRVLVGRRAREPRRRADAGGRPTRRSFRRAAQAIARGIA